MTNLTQEHLNAKQAFLNRQAEQMLATYKQADKSERIAVIKQIDSFLEIVSQDAKRFWLKFRYKLERLNEQQALFLLGQTVITIGAKEALEESNQLPNEFIKRHVSGDWGFVCKQDAEENDFSLKNGYRLLSAYKTAKGEKLWIITEADRSVTTILLPSDY